MIYAMVALFFICWIGFAVWAIRGGWSMIEGIGGGFIVGCLIPTIIVAVFMWCEGEQIPQSLKHAGISGKKWDAASMNLAAKITMKNLRDIQFLVEDADKRGDAKAAAQTANFLLPLMFEWNSQNQVGIGLYNNCQLAITHLSEGAVAVSKGGKFNQDRFSATMSACNQAIK